MDFENRLNEIALRAFGKPADELTEDELDDIREALRHFRFMIEDKGERVAVAESRAAIAYYTKGLSGSSRVRGTMNTATTAEEIIGILSDYAAADDEE